MNQIKEALKFLGFVFLGTLVCAAIGVIGSFVIVGILISLGVQ